MNSRIPGNYDGIFPSRNDAIEHLNNMDNWSDGWLYSVKYTTGADGQVNNIDGIGVILAVGIGNPEEYEEVNGHKFYRIVGDSRLYHNIMDFLSELGVTEVVVNGVCYTVINGEIKNQKTEDPFRIEKLN